MMNNAYRDDLEAALARASDLEHQVIRLRMRVAELETGDRATVEARENARRLEAALDREREELQRHHEQDVETEGRAQAARILGKAYSPAPPPADPYAMQRRAIAAVSLLAGIVTAVDSVKTDSATIAVCFVALIVIAAALLSVDADASAGRRRRTR